MKKIMWIAKIYSIMLLGRSKDLRDAVICNIHYPLNKLKMNGFLGIFFGF